MKKMSRKSSLMVLVTTMAMTFSAASLSAAERVRVGQWEVVSTGGVNLTQKICLGAAEAGAINGDAKASRAYAEKLIQGLCKFTDYRVEGNSAFATMTCGTTTVRTVTTYHGDTYEGESKTKTGAAAEVVSHTKAKRLGDCP